nr:reverse transcriptase domain-containing protein [Tanacetum cinerariifolium]
MKGAPECMRISGFMHGINNPELTKCLNEHVPRTMEEMMIATTAFIRGEVTAANKKKGHMTPKEILAAEANKFQPPPPMVTPVEKRNDGPLVIEAEVGGHTIHRMYIDGGSSMEIIYEHCFNWLRPDIKKQMVPATTSLTGFSSETTWLLGQLKLLVTIGDATHSIKAWMNFMIVKSLSPYNGIIGRPGLKAIQANIDNVREGYPPVRQKKRGQAPERTKAIQAEVEKLVEAGIMREVYYHDWLSNPVM